MEELGYNEQIKKLMEAPDLAEFQAGRVIAEHRERYVVRTAEGELEAEVTGNLRFSAGSRLDFPAVGDWVALAAHDPDFAIIHRVLPRSSVITRQAVGQFGEVQVIAANVDHAFIVQAVDRDFNINRLERYLTICNASRVGPVIVLTKTDLTDAESVSEIVEKVKKRITNIPVIPLSNHTQEGYSQIKELIRKGKTYSLLGSSGVGKSTLINNLLGKTAMQTGDISKSTGKGKHVTSHRELVILENGGILVDNPGMREVGIADAGSGLEETFDVIHDVSNNCKYKDCTHVHEAGCAVREAIEKGDIDHAAYENYLKMVKEKQHFETTAADKRKKEKLFGKILKDYHKKNIKQKR